jgi:hypothetical protein
VGVGPTRAQELGEQPCGERDRRDEQQQEEVEVEERPVDHGHAVDEGVVVHPHDPDDGEGDDVRGERRPVVDEGAPQPVIPVDLAGARHGEVEREQRDRDRQHAVAEGLEP